LKKFLTGEKNRTKKNTTEKMTTPMPMGRKQKKWMRGYPLTIMFKQRKMYANSDKNDFT